jgi:cap1 methyltransferase
LHEFSQFKHGTYLQYRICEGVDGTGDVFRWENVETLGEMMKADACEQPRLKTSPSSTEEAHCNNQVGKAHLVLADGGFDAQRDSEHQEDVAQKLIICEVAAGLALLRVGGTLVIKMFGFQTEVIRTLVRDLDSMFHQLVALKPISSRPASAERYLVCTNFQGVSSSDWDGRKWSSRMFLGQHGQQSQQQLVSQRIERYLDQFDCDMLGLNLKACFHILSFLESKCLAATKNGEQSDLSSNTSDFIYSNNANESIVDIEAYKRSWQLV